jgi:hypothetical protein
MLGKLLRTTLFAAAALAAAVGLIALTGPSRIATALGLGAAEPLQVGTAFGIAFLLVVVAVLLRPRGGAVEYRHVRHHEPAEVRRPVPQDLRPKVGDKLRAKVRASAGQKVAAQKVAAKGRAVTPRPAARGR